VASAQNAPNPKIEEARELKACAQLVFGGFLQIPDVCAPRFLGKVQENTMVCRGGQRSLQFRLTPWVDWSQYWGTGDTASLPTGYLSKNAAGFRGATGALTDLEYQRIELIKFNLFDNSGAWKDYVTGVNGVGGPAVKVWPAMRLPKTNAEYEAVGGDGEQV
jgi:hypothetical protein